MALTAKEKEILISQLLAMQEQINSVLFLLSEGECEHPLNNRLNLTVMGGPEHWQCKECGYEYKEEI